MSGYLEFEEKLDETETDPWTLEVDLAPFNANVPKIQRHDRVPSSEQRDNSEMCTLADVRQQTRRTAFTQHATV